MNLKCIVDSTMSTRTRNEELLAASHTALFQMCSKFVLSCVHTNVFVIVRVHACTLLCMLVLECARACVHVRMCYEGRREGGREKGGCTWTKWFFVCVFFHDRNSVGNFCSSFFNGFLGNNNNNLSVSVCVLTVCRYRTCTRVYKKMSSLFYGGNRI